ILLAKLRSRGIVGPLLSWIADYLRNRVQRVRIYDALSYPEPIRSGVIQGSVLGPLFFVIFVDDLDRCVSSSLLVKYADDMKLSLPFYVDDVNAASIAVYSESLQRDLMSVESWSNLNGLSLNVIKCKTLHFGSRNPHHQYMLSGLTLEQCNEFKDLGVILSKSLNFKVHVSRTVSKASRMLGMLKKSFCSRDPLLFLILYKSFVRSILEYSCVLWAPHNKGLIFSIEKVQKRFCRFFKHLNGLDYRSKLANLNLLSLEARRLRYKLIFLYKMMNGLVDLPVNELCTFSGRLYSPHPYDRLLVPHSKHSYRAHFFLVDVVPHWNSMFISERKVDNVSQFKKSVASYFTRNDIW
ncbi:MAG: reverse transcriptase domain-containing protein, partial [Pseudomonadota bacterium]